MVVLPSPHTYGHTVCRADTANVGTDEPRTSVMMETKELSLAHTSPHLSAQGRGPMLSTSLESPLTALVKSLLHPLLATVSLLVCVYAYGEQFTGYYLLLAVLTFFIAS